LSQHISNIERQRFILYIREGMSKNKVAPCGQLT